MPLVTSAPALPKLGPLEKFYVIWLAGCSCDGCTIAVTGATNPRLEDLLAGRVPGLPQIVLIHTALAYEAGDAYVRHLRAAAAGQLDAPFAVVLEGSVADESRAGDGYWTAVGEENGRHVTTAEWIRRLAPHAAVMIAIGTCATWGGIPAGQGSPTGAMGLMDYLGPDYRSALGLPVINIPGCSPIGDNFMETVGALLLYVQGIGPLPEFDELGRPAWLYGRTAHQNCPRAGYYEEGVFAKSYGDPECLVELGCWGPVVQCNVPRRGWINGMGGCTQMGGICIGCTMPGFPDKFGPIYAKPPGAEISSAVSRVVGGGIRKLRSVTQADKNRSVRWDKTGRIPSAWGKGQRSLGLVERLILKAYKRIQSNR